MEDTLPEEVLHFLDSFIDSVELLRVLLLLYAEPQRIWNKSEITMELRSTDSSITKRLNDLYSRKVLIKIPELKDRHKFSPSSPDVESIIRSLAEQNQLRPYRVIDAIYSSPSNGLRAFADAFRLRGGKS